MTTVRTAAARVLDRVEAGRSTLPSAIEREREGLADERDRGLLVELAFGVERWRAALDAVVAGAAGRAVNELDPVVRAVLRLGTYQLLHLDRVPAHAVVHEAVESTRALGRARAAGLVNAVLRSIQRGAGQAAVPAPVGESAPTADQLAYLTTTLSHPAWLVERWLSRYGFRATEAWCQFNNAAPTLAVRAAAPGDASSLLSEVAEAEPGAKIPKAAADALVLPPGGWSRLPAALRDQLVIQDEGAQLVAHAVDARPGMACLDLCAAPGGKTTVLWRDMHMTGALVAADRRPGRVRLLRATLDRAGVPAAIVALDATLPLPFGPVFDRVLVDAPCSGLGTLRRDPDIKWTRQPADLARLAATQGQMLHEAAESVRPGGWLVYATCSSEPDENDAVVDAFLAADPRFAVWSLRPGPYVEATGYLRTLPFRDQIDAFFTAVLVRSTGA
jgi:16S rRNA (cytosine967-C5)-methyltransferase